MAMSTDASAGVNYFNQAVTEGPVGNIAQSGSFRQSQNIALKSANGGNIGFSFKVGVFQSFSASGGHDGFAFLYSPPGGGGRGVSLLADSTNDELKKLAFGAHISTVPGIEGAEGAILLSRQSTTSANVRHLHGWAANATGLLADFRFTTANQTLDYGWVRQFWLPGAAGVAALRRRRYELNQ
jgi:hypothetical protein